MQDHVLQFNRALAAVTAAPVRNFFFAACGSSMAKMEPGQYGLEQGTDIPAFVYPSNELIHPAPHALGKGSVLILCSTAGSTPETVTAALPAQKRGALTSGLTHQVDSLLRQAAEYNIHYSNVEEAGCSVILCSLPQPRLNLRL